MASLIKRGSTWSLQDRLSGKIKRWSLHTDSLQIAREKLRQYESAKLRGIDSPLPTRTPIPDIVQAYVEHIRSRKTAKSAQTDVYYLREAFGPICDALRITSRHVTEKSRKRALILGDGPTDLRRRAHVIEAAYFEQITPTDVQTFIDGHVKRRGLAPKTANRYREILCRLFNCSMQTRRVRMPGGINPASQVERYKEQAPEIRFLTLAQIDEQLHALRFKPQLQTMVAMLIFAGLRREELVWLTLDDVELSRRAITGAWATAGYGVIRVRAKSIDGRSWQPKTRVNRAVPISKALRDYLDRYTPPATTSPTKDDHFRGWFFPAPGGGYWDPDNFSADLRDANRDAGLQWSSLDYRHTFGSQLAQRGVSLYKIATLMGNLPENCRRHYAALIPEAMATEVEFTLQESSSYGHIP